MMRTVVVAHNRLKPLTHASGPRGILGGCNPDAVVSGFFVVCYGSVNRGFHPPLDAVEATNSDKRGESGLCLLGEHPSGQRKLEPTERQCWTDG